MRDEKRVKEPGRCLCIYLEGAPDPCLFHRNKHGTSFFLACVLSEIPRIILMQFNYLIILNTFKYAITE